MTETEGSLETQSRNGISHRQLAAMAAHTSQMVSDAGMLGSCKFTLEAQSFISDG